MSPQTHDFPAPEELEPELLAKVFQGGGPLVQSIWTCPTCGLTVRGCPPRVCMDDRPDCPVETAL